MKPVVMAFASCLILSACTHVDPVRAPNKFGFMVWDGDIEGTYNPQGFTSDEVQTQIARGCLTDPEIIGYVETSAKNGLIGFRAECRVSKLFGDSYEYVVERAPNGFNLTRSSMITIP